MKLSFIIFIVVVPLCVVLLILLRKSKLSDGVRFSTALVLGISALALLASIGGYVVSSRSIVTTTENYLLKSLDSVSKGKCKVVYVDEHNKEHTDIVQKTNVKLNAKSDLSQYVAKRTKSEATKGPFTLEKIKWTVQSEKLYDKAIGDKSF